jgi:peptidoglycan/xylan/chitin deacetylase (PgdA/CDA1 family)
MLTFRNTSVAVIVVIALLILLGFLINVPWYVYVLPVFIYSLLLFYGSYRVDADFYMHVVCSSQTSDKKIAISFDDGPSHKYTVPILSLLKDRNIKAAFFCIGKNIPGNENILRDTFENGHLVANHSYSHANLFDFYSADKMYADLIHANKLIEQVTGKSPQLFRPPYGVTNPNLKRAVTKAGFIAVGWNVRSYDTVIKDEKKLLKRITAAIQPGAVFLFHDTCESTLKVLPAFLDELKSRGYVVERIDQLLKIPAYA